jgi:hypothetical protein
VYPDLAKQHNANGALAFAAYYFDAYDWGYATNDPTLVEKVAEGSCGGCSKYINGLKSVRARHAVLTGGRITIVARGLRTGNFNYKSDYVVRVVLNEEPIVVRGPGSAQSTAAAAITNFVSYLFVSWRGNEWKVHEEASDDAVS